MNKFKIYAIILAVLMLMSACGAEETVNSEENNAEGVAQSFTGKYIISADDAINKIDDDNVIFIDARGEDGAKDGHIKNAIVMAWQELANMGVDSGEDGWGHILPADELSEILREKGIDPNKEIILYATSNEGWGDDGRILWTLEAAGYEKLKMVDGGVRALKKAGVEFVKDETVLPACEVNIGNIDRKAVINTTELSQDYDDYKILDTREKKEYEGATLYGEAKGGHLPGAINIPFTDLFNNDGKLKSNDELKKLFEDNGLKTDDKIVAYCTGGIRSAYMQLIMNMLGYGDVKNYEGSYYVWAAQKDVEK